jgi:hypothetical protein
MYTIDYKFIGLRGVITQDKLKTLLTDICGKISGYSRMEKIVPTIASVENSDTMLGIIAVPDYAIVASYGHLEHYLELKIHSARGFRDAELLSYLMNNLPARIFEQTYRKI